MANVLVIGDTHCPGMRQAYPSFLHDIYDDWSCDRVVHIGDLVDWAAISYHEKNPSLSSAALEYEEALEQVQLLYDLFPKVDWLIGNHDSLTVRQATSVGLPEFVLKNYNELWQVPKWKAWPRFTTIEIDGVLYSHGDAGKGGMYSAVKNSRENFQSHVNGHWHSEAGVWWTANKKTRVFGMNVGSGMDQDLLQFEYGVKFNRKPMVGCGVVLDGKQAFWEPMLL